MPRPTSAASNKSKGSPIKMVELRRSPRKKAWASPAKTPTRAALTASALFNEADFSPLNGSWAEVTASDQELSQRCTSERKARKALSPKRSSTKPKFVRSLELEKAFTTKASSSRRGDRRDMPRPTTTREERGRKQEKETTQEKNPRKRHLSSSSTVTTGVSPRKRAAPSSSGRPARKAPKAEESSGGNTPVRTPTRQRLFSNKSMTSSPASSDFRPKDFWEEPTLGWCKDQAVIDKRAKELDKAKAKPVYARYIKEIPIASRVKGMHPRTPNKLINFSRRSWDSQVRVWKRSLYQWAGEEPSDSANTSFYSETSEEAAQPVDENKCDDDKPILAALTAEEIGGCGLTTLMGKFDTDESTTIKGEDSTVAGPTDFSMVC